MCVRMATEQDIPQILEIYAPYILNTAVSFEYTVPSLDIFSQRFFSVTVQFPWLVWEENGQVLGYAYGSAPFERAAFQWWRFAPQDGRKAGSAPYSSRPAADF